jgi:hypothetical protein
MKNNFFRNNYLGSLSVLYSYLNSQGTSRSRILHISKSEIRWGLVLWKKIRIQEFLLPVISDLYSFHERTSGFLAGYLNFGNSLRTMIICQNWVFHFFRIMVMNPKKHYDNCQHSHSHQRFWRCNKMLWQSCKLLVTLSDLEVLLGLFCFGVNA